MADRRGSDGYDWLYSGSGPGSGQGERPSSSDDAEHTRVLPPMGQSAPPPGGTRPPSRAPGSRPPGPPAPPVARPGKSRRPRFRFRWLLYLLVLWLAFLIGVPVYAWTSVSRVQADPKGDRPEEQPGTTYLVVGSDARKGLAGQRTDTIMLLHTGDGPSVLVSLPRDSIVEVPGHGTTKINAAFAYGGPRLLTQTVEMATGLRVDDYVEIGFTGFVKLVDAVGGITICPKQDMKDPLAGLDIKEGCQEADGATALGYARSRKTQQLGDIDRAAHQREVVSAIGSEVVSWQTVVNPLRYWNVVTSGADSVRVDNDTGPISAARFALGMTRADGENGLTCGVPIADLAVNWDRERADRLFQLIREDRTDEIGKNICQPSGMLP